MAFHLHHYHCRKESAEKSDSRLIQVPHQRLLKKPPVKRSTRKVTSMNKRSTDQPFFYSGSVFTTLSVAVVTCVPASQAEAAGGFWQIEGQLINVDRSGINNISECEQRNTTLRFRSRWSDGQGCIPGTNGECPWGVWWGTTTTNASGQFNKTSPFLFDVSRKRDVQIQFRAGTNEWKTIKVISNVGNSLPNQQNGGIRNFNLGILKTDHFQCPTVLVPGSRGEPRSLQPVADPNTNASTNTGVPDHGAPSEPAEAPTPSGAFAESPCGMEHQGNSSYDLAFESTAVRHRDNQPDAPMERITWEVLIRNDGTAPYSSTGRCRTAVRMSVYIPELDTTRVYEITLRGTIQPGETRKFTSNSGNLGEISEAASTSYNLKFEIDPENRVWELNEGNNIQPGCYTPSTGNYVDAVCG